MRFFAILLRLGLGPACLRHRRRSAFILPADALGSEDHLGEYFTTNFNAVLWGCEVITRRVVESLMHLANLTRREMERIAVAAAIIAHHVVAILRESPFEELRRSMLMNVERLHYLRKCATAGT